MHISKVIKKFFLGIGLIIVLGIIAAIVKPNVFERGLWHIKKSVQSVTQHDVKKMNIPLLAQTKNLNCEAATAQMILQYYGKKTTIDQIQSMLPLNQNPYKGFRGDVNGAVWGFTDYGVYAPPIAEVMTKLGVPSKAYTNISADFLKQKIMQGKPAIIWVNISNPNPQKKQVIVNGEHLTLISGEHVAVVTGYENGTWILNDPWRISKNGQRIPKQLYVDDLDSIMWNDFDHMAVIVD